MNLIELFRKQGDTLFRYRGQFPILIFILVIPFLFFTDYTYISYITNTCVFFSVLFSLLGLLIRFYTVGTSQKGTSGRNRDRQIADVLNDNGAYSVVRHPLYFANYLIWLGISIFTYNIYFIIIMSLLFWIYYERIMLTEEAFLEKKFGKYYLQWADCVPAFFPNIFLYKPSSISFSYITVLRREYSTILSSIIAFVYIELIRGYFQYNILVIDKLMLIIFLSVLVLVIILKLLKSYTDILNEDERS